MTPRRYQLRKDAVGIIERGHPWIFRDQLSTAAQVFRDGQWLRLVDGTNRVVGHGIYEADGAIAIRVLRLGPERPDAAWLRTKLAEAIAKRAAPTATTTGIRLVNGESDGIPAVVVDRFGDTIVVQSYSSGSDAIAHYVALVVRTDASAAVGPARHVVLRPARRRQGDVAEPRVVAGSPPALAHFDEDGVTYAVDLAAGHKTGAYLDLRGLRRAIAAAPLAGARVLDLFSYTGMLGRAAERAGASHVVHVDASQRALDLAMAHHVGDATRHQFVEADVFEWLPALDASATFDLVIVDPPSMTSRSAQIPSVLAAYRKLYRAAAAHLAPGGAIVAACCTSRIERTVFRRTVAETLGSEIALERELSPELDHPVGFPQADYLKITWWRRRTLRSA